ncbi:glutathione S-transferase family protein [Bradyrhizobium lablabi]|uniref:glutathione S-transferase family protein n=1 Tax=Bradyrhizobium lablabi TaxID=722472 RepID=UPI003D31FB32
MLVQHRRRRRIDSESRYRASSTRSNPLAVGFEGKRSRNPNTAKRDQPTLHERWCGETKTPEYTKLNPRQKIPLLQDGDFVIGESAAIVAYLSQTYSGRERSLVPEQAHDFAKWLEWCFFIVAERHGRPMQKARRRTRLPFRDVQPRATPVSVRLPGF